MRERDNNRRLVTQNAGLIQTMRSHRHNQAYLQDLADNLRRFLVRR